MSSEPAFTLDGDMVKKIKDYIITMEVLSPIGEAMKKVADELNKVDDLAEIVCMIG